MDNLSFTDPAKNMIADSYADDKIEARLKAEGLDDAEAQQITATAKAQYFELEYKIIARSNKLRFYLWVSLTSLTFLFFYIDCTTLGYRKL